LAKQLPDVVRSFGLPTAPTELASVERMMDRQNAFLHALPLPFQPTLATAKRRPALVEREEDATVKSAAFWRSITAPPARGRDGGVILPETARQK
jgi:hypothetical protein